MFNFKKSLTALVGIAVALLLTLAGTAAAQTQEQQKADKKTLDVNVTNVVPTHLGVPPGAFSFRTDNFSGMFNSLSGPEAEGTSFAVTSFTVTNTTPSATVIAELWGVWGTTSNCVLFSAGYSDQLGPKVTVPPGQTLHVTFPQPVIFSARPGPNSCLAVGTTGSASIYVVGHRLPPAEQPQQ